MTVKMTLNTSKIDAFTAYVKLKSAQNKNDYLL
jgi:hypothetical protein